MKRQRAITLGVKPLGVISLGLCGAISGVALNEFLSPARGSAYLEPYNQGGSITLEEAQNLQNYAPGQSYHAMTELLGTPNYRSEGQDVYEIQGTGQRAEDGTQITANRRLIVNYAVSSDCDYTCSKATDWRIQ